MQENATRRSLLWQGIFLALSGLHEKRARLLERPVFFIQLIIYLKN
jgi:hypothetical protein